MKSKLPRFQPPMLATLSDNTFSSKEWLFEPKLDGIRALAYKQGKSIELYSRRGLSITRRYPAITAELARHNANFVLDGEIVALDEKGRPSFQKLQERSGLTQSIDIQKAEKLNPVTYYIFDILFYNSKDLRSLSLTERKKNLHQLKINSKYIRTMEDLGSNGLTAFKACIKGGLEGVVAKRLNSSYQSNRRSLDWLKVKSTQSAEFIICGYTKGTGSRLGSFGSLILGEHKKSGKLVFVSNVGTGFDDKKLNQLRKLMKPLISKECPFHERPRGLAYPTWLKPKLVAEIKYAERTKDDHLRVPVFLHLREDIKPENVTPPPIAHIKSNSKKTSKKISIKRISTSAKI